MSRNLFIECFSFDIFMSRSTYTPVHTLPFFIKQCSVSEKLRSQLTVHYTQYDLVLTSPPLILIYFTLHTRLK